MCEEKFFCICVCVRCLCVRNTPGEKIWAFMIVWRACVWEWWDCVPEQTINMEALSWLSLERQWQSLLLILFSRPTCYLVFSFACYEDGSTPFGSNTTCYPHEQELLHICVGYFVPKGREDRSQDTQRASICIVDFWYSIFILQKNFHHSNKEPPST